MAGDQPEGAQDQFDALARMLVGVEPTLEATMSKIAAAARGVIESCDSVSITVIDRGRPETVGATDDRALDVDRAQYRSGAGPCLDAIAHRRIVRVPALQDATEAWGQRVAAAATEAGIGSSLSSPLVVAGDCLGGLNLYAAPNNAFSVADEEILRLFSERAAAVAANARAYWSMVETTQQLETALRSRAVIEQAKGMLMARQGCSADEAFDILRRASQRNNRKLRDLATDIVTGDANEGSRDA